MAEIELFTSAHSALVFAFNIASQCHARPMMNQMAAPAVGTGKGLGGLDGAGQSGMIRAEVEKLGKLPEAILIARVAPRSQPCSCRSACCSGQKINKEWANAIAYLADHVRSKALAGCVLNGLLRREYVERYFAAKLQRKDLAEIADKYEVHRNTTTAHYGKVANYFGGVRNSRESTPGFEELAQNAIDERLREIGIVG